MFPFPYCIVMPYSTPLGSLTFLCSYTEPSGLVSTNSQSDWLRAAIDQSSSWLLVGFLMVSFALKCSGKNGKLSE